MWGDPLSPLHGVPFGVKDIIDCAGMPTGFGTPLYGPVTAFRDAGCVALLKEAGAICLAVLRRDGFVSITAGERAGQLITKPFIATGNRLLLNVDVNEGGEATIEVLDENEQVIHGFERSGSVPLRGRSIEQTVRWTTRSTWSQLAGSKVRLRIRLRNADLYAFWTTGTNDR